MSVAAWCFRVVATPFLVLGYGMLLLADWCQARHERSRNVKWRRKWGLPVQ